MLRLSKNNSLNFCLLRCNFFFKNFGIQSLNNASKDYEKKSKIGQKIISKCEILRIFCMHFLIADEFYFIQEWKFY